MSIANFSHLLLNLQIIREFGTLNFLKCFIYAIQFLNQSYFYKYVFSY